ncbi:nicotinamide/nicotinic acid mononucleotide adenylyltransferase 1-like isoform X1 [Ylistrum balloti]|uniref:nicotinamide/nicotinic acid mononucleotide adenylyltransferase 1-like isoform X1 n=1 Tax=Ylistrum balloti TaxID=509963 RepID=UPI002905CDBB|nr:nicotinamide/nicotinic acid mononucleotide adenylyltransferase 1-like isoform X1 [Ylistrum balloti]
MATPTKVVLLACGSYSPVTNMHLRMFELAKDTLNKTGRYSVIGGIMSPVSDGYGKKGLVSAKHRCAMLKNALKTSDWIRLDTWECEQPSWTETAKVLSHHLSMLEKSCKVNTKPAPTKKRRKDLHNESINEDEIDRGLESPNSYNTRLSSGVSNKENVMVKLLCGGDLLESFGTPGLWKEEDIEDIVSNHGLVCITRAGSDPRKFIYESDILSKYQENIFIVTEWIENDISATKIRRAIRRGESVKYLIQDPVIDYIKEHGLYGVSNNKYINDFLKSPADDPTIFSDFVDAPLHVDLPDVTRQPVSNPRTYMEDSDAPRSPKRQLSSDHYDDCPRSPKSPRNVPCMTDIGTLVRRVRNYNLSRGIPHQKMDHL